MIRFFRAALPFLLAGFALSFSPAPALAFDIQRVVSPGGIEAWLIPDAKVPVLALHFCFASGTTLDPAGKEGLAHFTTALLDEGAGELDSQSFQGKLSDETISLSFGADPDHVCGGFRTLNETRRDAVELTRLALTAPRFDSEPVERVRVDAITAARRALADPQALLGRTFSALVFKGHPYARPAGGTPESLEAISVEDMRAFVRQSLTRDHLLVTAAGDITPAALGEMVDTIFAALPAGSPAAPVPEAVLQAAGETVVFPYKIPQSLITFGEPGVSRSDPDWWPARVMNYILGGGGFSSRLMEEVWKKRGLTYGIGSSLVANDHAALIMASASTANKSAGEALALMKQEWRRMAEGGVTAEELKNAKTFLTGAFALQFTSTGAIADILMDMRLHDLPIDYLDHRAQFINAVTREDVQRAARRLLHEDKLTTVVLGQPEGVTATRTVTEILQRSESC